MTIRSLHCFRWTPLLAGLLTGGQAAAQATANWHWRFDAEEINVATQTRVSVTVFNDSSSPVEIRPSGVHFGDMPDYGLLFDTTPSGQFVREIVPTSHSLGGVIAPGDSSSQIALSFSHWPPFDVPPYGARHAFAPRLTVLMGNACADWHLTSGCILQSKLPDQALIVTYQPVPEVASAALMAAGLLVLAVALKPRTPRAAS